MLLRFGAWLKCCFTSTDTVGLLGTEYQDVHLDFHTAPELRGGGGGDGGRSAWYKQYIGTLPPPPASVINV